MLMGLGMYKEISIIIIVFLSLMSRLGLSIAQPQTLLNKPAPSFLLQSINDTLVSFSQFKGKIILIDFFATWCVPCRAAIHYIKSILPKITTKNFVVVSIDIGESKDKVISFVNSNGMTWIVLLDITGSVSNTYMVKSIPTFFIVDQNGVIRYVHVGATKSFFDNIPNIVENLLSESTSNLKIGSVKIIVKNAQGQPINNASIEIYDQNNLLVCRGNTNMNGICIKNLNIGQYYIKILYRGFSKQVDIKIYEKQQSIVEVNLDIYIELLRIPLTFTNFIEIIIAVIVIMSGLIYVIYRKK